MGQWLSCDQLHPRLCELCSEAPGTQAHSLPHTHTHKPHMCSHKHKLHHTTSHICSPKLPKHTYNTTHTIHTMHTTHIHTHTHSTNTPYNITHGTTPHTHHTCTLDIHTTLQFTQRISYTFNTTHVYTQTYVPSLFTCTHSHTPYTCST